MDIIELRKIIQENGVAGAGGAGFPTYAKLDNRTNTIILNCAECEPLLKVHRQLLQQYAYEILSTLNMIADILKVKTIIMAVKEAYTKTIQAVRANIDSFNNIELKLLPEVYPMGDEVVLIYETTGKVVPPGSIPIGIGVAVFNVETVFNVYKAINNNEAVTHKYLTIAGEVNNPITLKAPIGISIEELIKYAGGVKVDSPIYIMGGPMTGNIIQPYDTITKTSNAILVMKNNHSLVNKKLSNTSINMKRAMSACCQCQMCTDLCPRNLLGHPIEPHSFMRAATSGNTSNINIYLNTMFCSQCGLCEMYACGQDLSPAKLIGDYKNGLRKNGVAIPKGELSEVNHMRGNRQIPIERLTSRLGLSEYDIPAPLEEIEIKTDIVKIQLGQSIGIPAIPVVNKNDIVHKGQMIANVTENKLSLPVHASISGIVLDINNKYITIKARGDINE